MRLRPRACTAIAIALAALGCGRLDTLAQTGARHVSGQRQDTESAINATQAAYSGYVIGCGPTLRAPAGVAEGTDEPLGCAVIERNARVRAGSSGPHVASIELTFIDRTTAVPTLTPGADDPLWDFFFALPAGRFERLRTLRARATFRDHRVVVGSEGLVVYDPERLTDRDERLNTFTVPDATAPIEVQRVEGHVLFATMATYRSGIDFKSITDADALCSAEATASARLAVYDWAALLSDADTSARDRVAPHGPVYDSRLERILDDASQLFAAQIFASPLRVAKGDIATNAIRVWTGSDADGRAEQGRTCASWQASDPALGAAVGNPSVADWLSADESSCDAARRLYCLSL